MGWSLLAFPMYNSSHIQTLVRVELLVGSNCGLDQIKKKSIGAYSRRGILPQLVSLNLT